MPRHTTSATSADIEYNASMLALGEAVRAGSSISAGQASDWVANVTGTGTVTPGLDTEVGDFVTFAATNPSSAYRAGRAFNKVLGAGRSISFKIRRNNAATTVMDLYSSLGSAGVTNVSRWNKSVSALTVGKWYWYSVSLGEQTDGGTIPNRIDLRDMTVQVTGDANGGGSISIGDIRLHQDKARAKAVIFFDDGRKDTYSTAYPIMNAKGFPGSVAVEHTAIGNSDRVTLTELRDLYSKGWDVCGHHTAQMTTLSSTAQEDVHKASKALMESNGFIRGSRIWVWPGGARNDSTEAIAKKYWQTMRRVSSFISTGHAHVYDPIDPPVYYVTKTSVLANVQAAIDRNDGAGATIVLVFHSIVPVTSANEDVSTSDFQAIVDHLATKSNTDVVPASRVWTH
ncbi:esterase [Arthrobacter phage Qui]|uniref:Esterase n=1 Tax=Arthrobacter phage Qui TaxID=2603260 RepID=A0A5B8WGT4_9CAUD|nr:esterase [Arthrobacter phage Qui]QED11501.1 esterase [Arthrobacter phage Qui]QOC56332.1 esterase [Arthrobacter phage Paella]